LKYRYLLNNSHISLWRRITGLMNEKLKNEDQDKTIIIDKQIVPLLLTDPVVLLLQIILNLPYSITKGITVNFIISLFFSFLEFYRVIVQALFNLTYIQALFTIVTEMNQTEQEMWSTTLMDQSENVCFDLKNMTKYLRIISFKLSQANFNSDMNNVCV